MSSVTVRGAGSGALNGRGDKTDLLTGYDESSRLDDELDDEDEVDDDDAVAERD